VPRAAPLWIADIGGLPVLRYRLLLAAGRRAVTIGNVVLSAT
jgi:hypothetical protein